MKTRALDETEREAGIVRADFPMTIGEVRGIAKVIEQYRHVTMRDQWDVRGGGEAVRLHRDGLGLLTIAVRTESPEEGFEWAPEDVWQILRNGHAEQLTSGTAVVVGTRVL